MLRPLLGTLLLFPLATLSAQTLDVLTVEKIMRDPAWIGSQPSNPRWSFDGSTIYFNWNPENEDFASTYAYTPGTDTQPRKMEEAIANALPSSRGTYNGTRTQWLYAQQGDLFLHTITDGTTRQLTNTVGRESSPAFSQDEQSIIFEADNNLFKLRLADSFLEQLTDIRDGKERNRNGEENSFLARENERLIDYISETQESQETRRTRREASAPDRPLPIYLGSGSAFGLQLSPDERFITYLKGTFGEGERTEMPNYLAASGYVAMENARPKVGAPETPTTLWIYDRQEGEHYQVSLEGLPGQDELPAYYTEYDRQPQDFSRDISFAFGGINYSPDGEYAVTQVYSVDNKDRWIVKVNLEEGSVENLNRQHDDAWIAGPGVGWFSQGTLGWIPNSSKLWFVSEASGYAHLYTIDLKNDKVQALTKGDFEIYNPQIGPKQEYFYFAANDEHPGIRHVYRMKVKGGKLEQLTSLIGGHEFVLSPTEEKLALRHSTATQPWELYWQANGTNAKPMRVTESISEEFQSYAWRTPDYVTFTASDGAEVYARLYKPENPTPDGPAVIFVHGAGYLQNAHQWWSSYFREYMFHNLLVDQGYTVLDMDYRASSGYGRDWRTGIYRHMGGKDLSDQVDGAKWLASNHGIDASRIGIYGGSYGGFITLMALFTEPDVFACGAALRSVTDWAHYNHPYTSPILNTPALDSIAYVRSSPIYFAEGLEKPLLMCHGMLDDNVQFQDIVRLTQRLIELGKEDWELAVYPAEPHGFRRPDAWTDEYKRILSLFEEHLK
ncbi:MAG TPA: S9 family peptidase [Cytophagales bacterium]|nr:S9 family peptidase [Cytophagales bacterium]HAP61513.1 S9 family peptidase [Cytophagales bacterium]